jgi:hypothetical protein
MELALAFSRQLKEIIAVTDVIAQPPLAAGWPTHNS